MELRKKLPPLTKEAEIKGDYTLDIFFHQMMTHASYINDSNGKVPDHLYADFLLYALKEELKNRFPEAEFKACNCA